MPWYDGLLAAYQPIGAANLAASYVNLANPGTYNLTLGVEPAFDTTTGWKGNGSTTYLKTGIIGLPNNAWSMMACYTSITKGDLFGFWTSSKGAMHIEIGSGSRMIMRNGSSGVECDNTPILTNGVYGFAALKSFRNGLPESVTLVAATASPGVEIYILALNIDGGVVNFTDAYVRAVAIANTTWSDAKALSLATAMAALPATPGGLIWGNPMDGLGNFFRGLN